MFWAGAHARLRLDRRMRVSAPTAKAKAARLVKIHHSIGYFLSAAEVRCRDAVAALAIAGSIASATAALPASDK